MKKPAYNFKGYFWLLTVIFGVLLAAPVSAQFGMGMQMMKFFSPFGEGFNPATIQMIDGKIARVYTEQGQTGAISVPVVMLTVETPDKLNFEIKLGPIWYIQSMDFSFRKADQVRVIGSVATVNGKKQVLCQTINKDGKTTEYRNGMGVPVWSPMAKQGGGGGHPGGGQPGGAADKGGAKTSGAQQGGMQGMMQMMQQMMMQRMGGGGKGMPGGGGGGQMAAPGGQGGGKAGNFGGGFSRGFGSGHGAESGDNAVNTEVEQNSDLE